MLRSRNMTYVDTIPRAGMPAFASSQKHSDSQLLHNNGADHAVIPNRSVSDSSSQLPERPINLPQPRDEGDEPGAGPGDPPQTTRVQQPAGTLHTGAPTAPPLSICQLIHSPYVSDPNAIQALAPSGTSASVSPIAASPQTVTGTDDQQEATPLSLPLTTGPGDQFHSHHGSEISLDAGRTVANNTGSTALPTGIHNGLLAPLHPSSAKFYVRASGAATGWPAGREPHGAASVAALGSRPGSPTPSRYLEEQQHQPNSGPSDPSRLTYTVDKTRTPPGDAHAHSGWNNTQFPTESARHDSTKVFAARRIPHDATPPTNNSACVQTAELAGIIVKSPGSSADKVTGHVAASRPPLSRETYSSNDNQIAQGG
ncbi:hypothetical protein GE09DRAFT_575942 [Coniochaeta sp. 2T2.1]|nr:hypothetical protein GE09DRAFT_575942 [Coniochaeta sp. 2T2.1]